MGMTAGEKKEMQDLKDAVQKLTKENINLTSRLNQVILVSNQQILITKLANEEIITVKKENNDLRQQVNKANFKNDAVEQYNRKESFRVNEVDEVESLDAEGKIQNREDVEKVVIEAAAAIGFTVMPDDIQRCHRVGKLKANSTRPRQVICKLKSYIN